MLLLDKQVSRRVGSMKAVDSRVRRGMHGVAFWRSGQLGLWAVRKAS